MAHKADQIIANLFTNRWQDTTVVAGATCHARSPSGNNLISANTRTYIDTLVYTLRNFVGSGGAAATVTTTVRQATTTGTVIAQIQNLVPASTVAQVSMTDLRWQSKRGGSIVVVNDTFVGSLTAAVNIAGWMQDENG